MKVLANFEDNNKIKTNSNLDDILGGGLELGTITQFFGPPGSGKTNIALVFTVNLAKTGKKVFYMDTEGGISIERIKQIAGPDFERISKNIMVFEPKTFKEQGDNLKLIESWIIKNPDDVGLIVVDSAVALYRVDDMKSSFLNKGLGRQMGLLSNLAREYGVAVLLTNQIYSAFDGENGNVKAVGGTILQYWSKIIVQLEKVVGNSKRKATLKRHKYLPEGLYTEFKINDSGID